MASGENLGSGSNIPYLGSKISLITTYDIRYEGILTSLNQKESTIAVQNVRSFGTEGRKVPEVPMSNEIYDYIVFSGKDLKDLTVIQEESSGNEAKKQQQQQSNSHAAPAASNTAQGTHAAPASNAAPAPAVQGGQQPGSNKDLGSPQQQGSQQPKMDQGNFGNQQGFQQGNGNGSQFPPQTQVPQQQSAFPPQQSSMGAPGGFNDSLGAGRNMQPGGFSDSLAAGTNPSGFNNNGAFNSNSPGQYNTNNQQFGAPQNYNQNNGQTNMFDQARNYASGTGAYGQYGAPYDSRGAPPLPGVPPPSMGSRQMSPPGSGNLQGSFDRKGGKGEGFPNSNGMLRNPSAAPPAAANGHFGTSPDRQNSYGTQNFTDNYTGSPSYNPNNEDYYGAAYNRGGSYAKGGDYYEDDYASRPKGKKGKGKGKDGEKGKGKGSKENDSRKTLKDLFAMYPKMSEFFVENIKKKTAIFLTREELVSASESNKNLYHFFLDFVNFCLNPRETHSENEQWEAFTKQVRRHFEGECEANPSTFKVQTSQPAAPGAAGYSSAVKAGASAAAGTGAADVRPSAGASVPARPQLTLGDFAVKKSNAAKEDGKKAQGASKKPVVMKAIKKEEVKKEEQVSQAIVDQVAKKHGATEWTCPRCTLQNPVGSGTCGACGFSKDQAKLMDEFPPLGGPVGGKKKIPRGPKKA